jgi:hypothetical protein
MNELMRITDENPTYCSMVVSNREQQKAFYNAVQNCDKKMSDYINKELTFTDVYMEKTEVMEKDAKGNPTGVIQDAVKIVLILEDGTGVVSTSKGILTSLYAMFRIFGTPDLWEEPMTVCVKQIETTKGRTFKLEVV